MGRYKHDTADGTWEVTLVFTPLEYGRLRGVYDQHVEYCKAKGWSCWGLDAFVEGLVLLYTHGPRSSAALSDREQAALGCDIPF